jgi:hypothetical protein
VCMPMSWDDAQFCRKAPLTSSSARWVFNVVHEAEIVDPDHRKPFGSECERESSCSAISVDYHTPR